MAQEAGTVSIMGALAVELAFTRWIQPQFQRSTGLGVETVWAPTTVLMKRIGEGKRGDVIVAIDEAMDRLSEGGIIRRETRIPIVRSLLGVGVRRGAPRPDISTVDGLKRALVEARGVAYSIGGASGIYFADLIKKLGIADEVNSRAVTIPAGFTATKVASGEAELAIQQISELMAVDGIDIVGPFPDDVQAVTDFSAAIFTDAPNPAGAGKFLEALGSAMAVKAYGDGGLTSRIRLSPSA